MRKKSFGRGCVVLLVLLLVQFSLLAGTPQEIASKTGLDQDLFSTLTVDVNGTQLGIFIVAVTERALYSRVSSSLASKLSSYVGKNALYINPTVKKVVSSFPFDPSKFKITQEDAAAFFPTTADWIEITNGFLSGHFVTNPGGASYGSGSEGLLLMDGHIDITRPFTVSYAGQSTTFSIRSYTAPSASTSSGVASTPSQTPVDVPLPDQVTDLQETLTTGEFTRESTASLFNLPPAVVQTLEITSRGTELRLLFVLLSDEVRNASFSDDLLTSIDPLIDTGAVMVWALSPTGSPFTPWSFFIQQNETNYVFFSDASFVELTSGFIRAKEVPAGQILAGVIRLQKGLDFSAPFKIFYGTSSVTFNTQ